VKNILVPIDFSASTPAVLRAAEDLARRSQARIVLVAVVRPPVVLSENAPATGDFALQDRGNAGKKLAACASKLAAAGFEVDAVERYGPPIPCIVEEATRAQAEYVVMGSHGHSAVYELFVGGTTAGVLKKAPCPVLIVPHGRRS
jgi:nucleotide-binding universal stress UspA family protein